MHEILTALHTSTEQDEELARELLSSNNQNFPQLASCLQNCLTIFLQSLHRTVLPYAYWALDDFYFQALEDNDSVVSLLGSADWLEGGAACNTVRIDIDLRTEPLLYSFKFHDTYGGKQKLYIGKSTDIWLLSDTGQAPTQRFLLFAGRVKVVRLVTGARST